MSFSLYRFELKQSLGSFITWTVVNIAVLALFFKFLMPYYLGQEEVMSSVMAQYPIEFLEAFGMNPQTIFRPEGFYSFGYTYFSILGTIMAAIITISIFFREKHNKSVEFLLVKPLSRSNIFLSKFVAAISYLIVFNGIYFLAYIGLSTTLDIAYPINKETILAGLAVFFLQLFIMQLCILLSVTLPKIRNISGAATGMGLGLFVLSMAIGFIDKKVLYYLSPYDLFNPKEIFLSGGFYPPYIATACIAALLALGLSYFRFVKSELKLL